MRSTSKRKPNGMPDNVINIFTAIKYLSNEAHNEKLEEVHSVLEKTVREIISIYHDDNFPIKKTDDKVDSLFLSFTFLLKFLTVGSLKAKYEFLDALSMVEKTSLLAKHEYSTGAN